jgi:glycosyltransferase involved in cell wall biosynthesis
MRIAFVSDAIYPYNKGGKEKRLYELAKRLVAMGNDVDIYCMKWWDGPKDRDDNGVHIHAISRLYPMYIGDRRSIKEGIMFGIACFKLFRVKFDAVDVDHMPFFPIFSMWIVCKIKRRRLYATWHEVWGKKYWVEYIGIAGYFAYVIERLSVYLPDIFISISGHTTNALITQLHVKKPIVTIPVGIDVEQIAGVVPGSSHYDILWAGRMLSNKRIDLLVCAVANLKAEGEIVSCLIIGEGPERKNLEALVKKLGVEKQVTFNNFYEDQNDVYALMKAAKLFVSPSVREGFGIVAIEANACGTPVVTNLATGNAMKDLITHGENGFAFDRTAEAMADILKEALEKSEDLEQQCLSYAKKFDWSKITNKLAEVYAQ